MSTGTTAGTTKAAGIIGFSVFSNNITAPTQIPGLLGWYDGNDPLGTGVIPANGFNISNWIDKSGNANNASNIGGSIPSYSNNAVFFNAAASNQLFFTNPSALVAGIAFSIFIVEKRQSAAQFTLMLGGTGALGRTNLEVGYRETNRFTTSFKNDDQNVTIPSYTTAATEPYRIWTTTLNSSRLANIYLNGTTQGSISHNGLILSWVGGAIGGTTIEPGWYAGFIQEILFYSNSVTAIQQQQIEGYLAWKWKLNSNLPLSDFQKNSNVTGMPVLLPTTANVYNAPFTNFITSPTQVAGLQLWLDGADTATTTLTGSNITLWGDKSGNANNFTVISGAPTYNTTELAVSFVSSNSVNSDVMKSVSNIAFIAGSNNVFVVAKIPTNPFYNFQIIFNVGVGGDNSLRTNYNSPPNIYPNQGFTGTKNTLYYTGIPILNTGLDTPAYPATTRFIVDSVYGSFNTTTQVTLSSAGFIGGAYRGLTGFIYEVLMYSNALTTTQCTQVEGYLAWKWGINSNLPVSHYQQNSNVTGMPAPIPASIIPKFVTSSFLPTAYSGLALWLDAADATTIQFSSGANVSNWIDKSGNGRNGIQAISIQQPTYTNKGVNFIRANNTNLVTTYTAQPITEYLFIVINYTNPGGNAENIIRGNGLQSRQIFLNSSTNCILGVESLASYTSATLSQNQIILLETIYISNISNAQINVNGSIVATANTGIVGSNPFNTGAGNTTIGYNTNSMDSTVYEVIVFSNVLTSQQQQNIEGYLAWKWGLTGSLPGTHQNIYIPP